MKAPILILPVMLAACATQPPPLPPEPPVSSARPVYTAQNLQVPQRLPAGPDTPEERLTRAEIGNMLKDQNEARLELPNLNCFVGAACEYWFKSEGPPYLVVMEEGNKTDIQLQRGEISTSISSPRQAGPYSIREEVRWDGR